MKLMGHSSGVVGVACAVTVLAVSTAQGPSVEFNGQNGRTYLVRVGGSGDVTGSGKLFAASFGTPCPWDCEASPDGAVGINDFQDLLSQWTTLGSCDFDGGGVGINDFLLLLANWGLCPPPSEKCFDQQPNQSNGIFSDLDCDACVAGGNPPTQVLAEQLVLISAEMIDELRFWGGYFPGDAGGGVPPPDSFTVKFRLNDSSPGVDVPGDLVRKLKIGPADTRTETGLLPFGVREFEYVINLEPNQDLTPGFYWVEIYNDTTSDPTNDDWFWETGTVDAVNGLPGSVFTFEPPNVPSKAWQIDAVNDLSLSITCKF